MPIFENKNTSRISSLYPTERQKHVQTMLQLMYYCKNTGCITKNALGDRYDDFEKHEEIVDFFEKNMSRITPLDPTERYKHVETMVQVVFIPKKHGFHDERCSGGLVR